MNLIKKIIRSYSEIVFPVTCVCCGASQEKKGQYICEWCKNDRFERVYSDSPKVVPAKIEFVYSMWNFDKGGYLQNMLHNLKYNFLRGVGEELGEYTAQTFINSYSNQIQFENKKPILIPVPLHKSKKRKRGYNQARALARGFANVTGWDIIEKGVVKRTRRTQTQTGLNSSERTINLKGAFKLINMEKIQNRFPVIIDDVFTTGATTYELADTLLADNGGKAGIITVARA